MPTKKKVAKPRAKKPVTLRQILDQIDDVLVKGDDTAKALWDVLTGLRGPDDYQNQSLKYTGTIHIRAAAFPKTAAGDEILAFFNTAGPMEVPFAYAGHIQRHIHEALISLGLTDAERAK